MFRRLFCTADSKWQIQKYKKMGGGFRLKDICVDDFDWIPPTSQDLSVSGEQFKIAYF